MMNAIHRKVVRSVTMMGDDGEVFQLLAVHRFRFGEVAYIDDIGFNQLI